MYCVWREKISLDKTYVYEYNGIGNITKVKNYHYRLIDPLTNCSTDTEYTYDTTHSDRLIAVDGNSITYNSLGCVQTYKGKEGIGISIGGSVLEIGYDDYYDYWGSASFSEVLSFFIGGAVFYETYI